MVNDYQNIQLRIAKASKELEELEKKVSQAKEARTLIQDECEKNLKDTNEAIAVYLGNARKDLDKMYSEKGSVLSSKESLEKAIESIKQHKTNEVDKITVIRRMVVDEEGKLAKVKDELDIATKQVDGRKKEFSNLDNEVNLRKGLMAEKDKVVEEGLKLEKKNQDLDKQIERYLGLEENTKQKQYALSLKEKDLAIEKAKAKSQFEAYGRREKQLEEMSKFLEKECVAKGKDLLELTEKISKFVDIDDAQSAKQTLDSEVSFLIERIKEERIVLANLQVKNEAISKEISKFDDEEKQYVVSCQLREQYLTSLEDKIKQKQCDLTKLEDEKLQKQKKAQGEEQAILAQADGQQTRLGLLKGQVQSLEVKIEERQVSLNKLEAMVARQSKEVATANKEVNSLKNERNKLSTEVKKGREELERSLSEVEKWRKEAEEFSRRYSELEEKEKETKKMYNEVAVMYVRLKPKYLKVFKKFNNLE